MQFRSLGDLRVPAVGMGTWKTFDVASEAEVSVRRRIVDQCVSHEVTFIDTSPMYGRSEEVIGATISGRRERFQLATKVWTEGRDSGESQIARSFQLMGADFIEVFQIHNLMDWRTHLPTLERLKEQGKIGSIGITYYSPGAYPEMAQIMKSGRVDAIQVPYNVRQRECEDRVLPLAEELGIGVIVMEPLAKGLLVKGLRREPDLSPLADAGIRTWGQALLAWVLGDSRVSVAIPATARPERIEENAASGSTDALPGELRDYIRLEAERCL